MTIGQWLDRREPAPPARLRESLDRMVGRRLAEPVSHGPAVLLEVARAELHRLVRGSSTGRDVALDLLAVDALVTYGFQAAAEHPASLASLAQDTFAALSEIAPS
jgi:hypothetical protein